MSTSSNGGVLGDRICPSARGAVAPWCRRLYSEWKALELIWTWCSSRNGTSRSSSQSRQRPSARSPKLWDRCVAGGGAVTSASLHRAKMHPLLCSVPEGSCRRYQCVQSIRDPEIDPERGAHRPEVFWQSTRDGDYRGWDRSDPPVRLWDAYPQSGTGRWCWMILANALLLEVWLFPSVRLAAGKSTWHSHIWMQMMWPHCILSPCFYSDDIRFTWRTLIDGRRCESCICNRKTNHWMKHLSWPPSNCSRSTWWESKQPMLQLMRLLQYQQPWKDRRAACSSSSR